MPALVNCCLCMLEHFEIRTLEHAAFFYARVWALKKIFSGDISRINAHKKHINLCTHKFMRVYATVGRHPLSRWITVFCFLIVIKKILLKWPLVVAPLDLSFPMMYNTWGVWQVYIFWQNTSHKFSRRKCTIFSSSKDGKMVHFLRTCLLGGGGEAVGDALSSSTY